MKAVQNLMQKGVDDGVFPGGVLLAARQSRIVFLGALGRARLSPDRPMTTDTVFDLASLTKPLATTVSLMVLCQKGAVEPDQTLAHLVPPFSQTDKAGISVRQLLSHTSGLPDYQPYYERLKNHPRQTRKKMLQDLLLAEPLVHKPGTVGLYSDLGFMILQWVVETLAKKPLDRFVHDTVYGPLALTGLFFNPLNAPPKTDLHAYAATEDCPWRQKVLEGEVHDDNAHAMGGVAGHAGLFGTAQEVFRLLQELLHTYLGTAPSGVFRQDVVRAFFKRQTDRDSWALGFDTPTRPDSSSGKHFSDQSVGHLGFTGTSFWMDLEKAITVILLTNRVHPNRANEKIKSFRPEIHDAVVEALQGKGISKPAGQIKDVTDR